MTRQTVTLKAETILRLSGTGIFQILIATTSWVGLTLVVTGFASLAVAGYGIATRIVMFALMPSFGTANAAATLVGQILAPVARSAPSRQCGARPSITWSFSGASASSSSRSATLSCVRSPQTRDRRLRDERAAHHQRRVRVLCVRHGRNPVVSTERATRARRRSSTSVASGCSSCRSCGCSRSHWASARKACSSPC